MLWSLLMRLLGGSGLRLGLGRADCDRQSDGLPAGPAQCIADLGREAPFYDLLGVFIGHREHCCPRDQDERLAVAQPALVLRLDGLATLK